MINILVMALSLSLAVSCGKRSSDTNCPANENLSPTGSGCRVTPIVADPTGTPVPEAALTFETNLTFLNAASPDEEKFQAAVELLKKVVATEEFRNRVYNHVYNGVQTFVDNRNYSNAEIYELILEGAEKLTPTKNNQMDMQVELYYADTRTIGYTYTNVTKIWVNTKFFTVNSVASVAANLMHEWLHKLGFSHASTYSVSRDYSVPYAVGRMVGSIGSGL